MRGILVVNKPAGISSYDVVRRVKPLLARGTAIGHAGTLDPIAAGVLVLLVGDATKISALLMRHDKEYDAVVRLGVETDTDDITGTVIGGSDPRRVSPAVIEPALAALTGRINQVPPRYAALKQAGQPLYRLARAGRPANPAARAVTVASLELTRWDPPLLTIRCAVSAGTYIRALARDIGRALGTGATLESLTRTRSGRFSLATATALEQLVQSDLQSRLVSIPEALRGTLPEIVLGADDAARLAHGQPVAARPTPVGTALARTADDEFLALVNVSDGLARPERIICAA
jgi:tRNA pseudouridine55 synthase